MRRPELVLIGGGHAHVQVLRGLSMSPIAADVTVIVDHPVAVYSGMVPGLVAGQYTPDEVEIDVRPLARRAGARVIVARAERVDLADRRLHLDGRPPVRFDVASLNVGSTVAGLELPGVREHTLPTRPIAALVRGIDERLDRLGEAPRVVVVGAGAGGIELAFCLDVRLRAAGRRPEITLLTRSASPLAEAPGRLSAAIVAAARDRGIRTLGSAEVVAVRADSVDLADGRALPADLVVWVAGASALPLARQSGLPVDERGFVYVDDELRVADGLFAVGDCAVLRSWPEIPKAGVYAVREGPVLLENLRRTVGGRPLVAYRPQRDFLKLLNLGDGTAIGEKWGVVGISRAMFRWKDHIDRRFMERFQVLGPTGAPNEAFTRGMPPMADVDMVCGGCAAKVAETPLRRALSRLPPALPAPEVVLGLAHADDAVAVRHGGSALVASVDAFTAFVDDPWTVGRVAAQNATSDLWAKNGAPRWALANVAIPADRDPEETLFQVLAGARSAFDADGVVLLGGHTTVGDPLTVGFTVFGDGEPDRLWRNDGLRPGDRLLLTRALGTGVLFHADMAGRAKGPWIEAALAGMARGNGPAARAIGGFAPTAVTDVTGFGLAGHLGTMLRASGVSATVDLSAIPALPGALPLLASGERSTFHDGNRDVVKALRVDEPARVAALELLFDPQTAGGLLLGVGADQVEGVLAALRSAGEVDAAAIGVVTAPRADAALFEVIRA